MCMGNHYGNFQETNNDPNQTEVEQFVSRGQSS